MKPCPECGRPTPANEHFAYGRCEDCYNRVDEFGPVFGEPVRADIGAKHHLESGLSEVTQSRLEAYQSRSDAG